MYEFEYNVNVRSVSINVTYFLYIFSLITIEKKGKYIKHWLQLTWTSNLKVIYQNYYSFHE